MLPVDVGDYTDFYSCLEHASNASKIFLGSNARPLPSNWKHLPLGYNGRASSIVVSGTDIARPKGQILTNGAPVFSATSKLDFELELAFIIGVNTNHGEPIKIERAEDAIFGVALFNDWSARDIQQWEYIPLGPFLSKSFASSISPWVLPLEALEPFRIKGPIQEPLPLEYLCSNKYQNFDIDLEVYLQPEGEEPDRISKTNFGSMYWSMAQQIAHYTSNGCNLRIGDVMASGAISGNEIGSYGSLLEISWGGNQPFILSNGMTRTFLQDGDRIILRGKAEKDDLRVGLGEVSAKILP